MTGKQIPEIGDTCADAFLFGDGDKGLHQKGYIDGALRQRRLGALGSVDSVGCSDIESGGGDEESTEDKTKEKE